MAQNINQTGEYGNPVHHQQQQTDEYGNPVHHQQQHGTTHDTNTGFGQKQQHGATHSETHGQQGLIPGSGAGGLGHLIHHGGQGAGADAGLHDGSGTGTGGYGKQQPGVLQRSGSSSSSSSEDDGLGGRRKKKGLTGKIKEKLPGHKHDDQNQVHGGPTTAPGGYGDGVPLAAPGRRQPGQEHQEKKGIVEKIKEKLPGGHHA